MTPDTPDHSEFTDRPDILDMPAVPVRRATPPPAAPPVQAAPQKSSGEQRGPSGPGLRAIRRFRRRSTGTQIATVAVVVAIIVALVAVVALSSSKKGTGAGTAPKTGTKQTSSAASAVLASASTTTAGIVGNQIRVVFPLISLNSTVGKSYALTKEYREQKQAINFYVGQINKAGGINGRKILATIVTFTPENSTETAALCKDWTEGGTPAFAVLDPTGTWTGTSQLCITKYGHTPLIAQWSSATTWTTEAAPYLWWMGTDQAELLQALVQWGQSAKLLTAASHVAVIAGNTASDALSLKTYLLPDLKKIGITPLVETMASSPTDTATTDAQAPIVVQKLHAAGITSVIPLAAENVLEPVLQAENQQNYIPHLLLSDDWTTIRDGLSLLTIFPKTLQGQEGITAETLGGFDDPRPEPLGGYDPGVRACYTAWNKAYPHPAFATQKYNYIEEQGPIEAQCIGIKLFATAAKAAGKKLNRRSFVQAMAKIKNFQGGVSRLLNFAPGKYYGPTQYRVVQIWTNKTPSSKCDLKTTGKPQGNCWYPVGGYLKGYLPLPKG